MAHLPIYQSQDPLNGRGRIGRKKLIALVVAGIVALVFVASEFGYGFVVSSRDGVGLGFGSGDGNRSSSGLISSFLQQIGVSQPQPKIVVQLTATTTPLPTAATSKTVAATLAPGQLAVQNPGNPRTASATPLATTQPIAVAAVLPTVTPAPSNKLVAAGTTLNTTSVAGPVTTSTPTVISNNTTQAVVAGPIPTVPLLLPIATPGIPTVFGPTVLPIATPTATNGSQPVLTNTPVPPASTNTPVPPTATNVSGSPVTQPNPTATNVPPVPTSTPVPPAPTNTPIIPSPTVTLPPILPTNTPIPPAPTNTPIIPLPTITLPPLPTITLPPILPTNTPIPPAPTNTPRPTATPIIVLPTITLPPLLPTNTPVPPTPTEEAHKPTTIPNPTSTPAPTATSIIILPTLPLPTLPHL